VPPFRTNHLYVLDGLRALAVAVVMLRHFSVSHFFGGFLGVDLFFVLSGFLITRLLTQEFEASGSIRFDLFYLRRVCRLLPAIIVLLIFVTTLRALMPATFGTTLSWWFSDLAVLFSFANFFSTPLEALGHTWSLSVEEQFYFLWPMTLLVILRRCRTLRGGIAVTLALALSGATVRAWLQSRGGLGIDLYCFLFARMDCLLIGAALALAEGLPNFAGLCARACRLRPGEIAMVVFILIVVLMKDRQMFLMYYGGWTLIALLFAVLVAATVYDPRPTLLKRLLESHPLVWLGRRSYGIYLYHLPIFYLVTPLHVKYPGFASQAAYIGLGLTVPVILAALSYHYVELPFLKRKVHLKWNFPKQELGVPAGEKAAI
jgi:peptidoglycan/LPS O-acetylase OafA/YrhL